MTKAEKEAKRLRDNAKSRKYYWANRDKCVAKVTRWKRANVEKNRLNSRVSARKKRHTPGAARRMNVRKSNLMKMARALIRAGVVPLAILKEFNLTPYGVAA